MRTLCKYCVKKPVTVLMAVLIIIVFGIFSLTRMSMALFPNLNLPYAVVVTTYVGANPEQVEKEVTIPIEQQLVTLTNYHSLTSTSNEHYSMIMIEFEDNTNMDNAFLEMRESLDSISFVDGVEKPKIMRITADMMPIVTVSVAKTYEEGTTDQEALIKTTQWIKNDLESELLKIDGVAQISYNGTADVVLDISIDAIRRKELTKDTLDNGAILQIIQDTNDADGLIGVTTDTDGIKMLYIGNPTKTIEELTNLPIYYNEDLPEGQRTITLGQILTKPITFKNNNSSSYNKINGLSGISISFQQDSSAELTTVVKNIKSKLSQIEKDNPGTQIIYILDQGEYVESSLGTVLDNLIQGALLAVIILLIFLISIKPTLIVAISIPTSIIGTFVAMYFAGINMNIVSMGGLALGIGMLVDNSVVVIENIFRMIKEGKSKKEAAIHGAAEVAGAITASTLTTLAVFIPIMFLKGLAGSIFKEMALTVCFSLGCSLIIALTVVPSAAAQFLKDKDDEVKETKIKKLADKINSNKKVGYTVTGLVIALIATSVVLVFKLAVKLNLFYSILIGAVVAAFMIVALISSREKLENKEGKITKAYEKTIRWSLNHRVIVLLGSIALLAVSTVLAFTRGFALIPATDEGSVSGSIVLNADTMTKDEIYFAADDCTKAIMDSTKDIETIQTVVGSNSLMATILGQSGGGSTVNFTVALKEDRKKSTIENKKIIEKAVIDCLNDGYEKDDVVDIDFSEASSMTSMLGTSGTQIYVEGSDLNDMEVVANALVEVLKGVEGVEKPSNGISKGNDTVKITVNKDEAIKKGLYSKNYADGITLVNKSLGYSFDTAGQETLKVNVDGVRYEISTTSTGSIENFSMPKDIILGSIAVFDSNISSLLKNYEGTVYLKLEEDPRIKPLINYGDEFGEYFTVVLADPTKAEEAAYALIQKLAAKGVDPTEAQMMLYNVMSIFTGTSKLFAINPNLCYNSKYNSLIEYNLSDSTVYTINPDGTIHDVALDEDVPDVVTVSSLVKTYIMDGVTTSINTQTGFTTISRNGKNRYLLVTGELRDGYNATKVGSKVTEAVNKYLKSDEFKPYKNSIKVYEQGENEQIMDVVKQLAVCGVVAILLVYMIMCIQFQSLKYPLIIMGTIPLAFTGGFFLLFVCGMELSMVALIGLVVLVGVVVNNGIVIVDYMNQLVEGGMHIKEAAVVAGKTRLRPIFMTALTTIFALLTMALGIGESAEIMQPLAVAAIGGLTYATLLTLLVVPSLYVMMSRRKIKKEEANDTNSNIVEESESNGEIATNEE